MTRALSPEAREADPEAALSEWDAGFRNDLTALFEDEVIDAAIEPGRPLELPPLPGFSYVAFVDSSAGRHDAFTIGVAHREGDRIVLDLVRGRKPQFDPASVAGEFAGIARAYRCSVVVGDNYSGEWVAKAFETCGVRYQRAERPKSALYLEALPVFTRGQISIPDYAPLIRELRMLERRVSRSGKDSVDHPRGGSDDYANAALGAVSLVGSARTSLNVSRETAKVFGEAMSAMTRRQQNGTLRGFGRSVVTPFGWD